MRSATTTAAGASSPQNYSRFSRRSHQRNPATLQIAAPDRIVQLLEDQVAELRTMLANMRQREEDLQRDRDHWRTAFENTQRLLPPPPRQDAVSTQPTQPDQKPPETVGFSEPQPVGRLRRAWRWMRATG